jgi:serine/threonine protein kinase
MQKQLNHPNIVRLLNHYYEEDKNVTYMVLEYINGGTLFEKIKMNGLSKRAQHMVFRELCSAVETMHTNGIMHRDIKVELLLLSQKTFYSRSPAKRKSATSGSQLCLGKGVPFVAHTNTWHPR